MNHPHREQDVSRAFVALADTLVDDYDIIALLDQLVAHSVALLSAEAAGLLLADPHHQLRVVAASSEDARTMELLQLQAEEGPCLDSYRTGAQVRVADVHDSVGRWPNFTDAVRRTSAFRSVHAIPLRLRGQTLGALNLFHRDPGPLPEDDLALAQALADIATIGILQERAIRRGEVLNEQLQTALNSRVVIEQAKGVIAQTGGLDMDAAFDLLRQHARRHQLRLSELARQIVNRELDATVLHSSNQPSRPTGRPSE